MRTLLISLLLLAFLGCAEKTVYVPVPAPDCSVPPTPVYRMLDETKHIAEPENIETLMLIISDMSAYIKQLKSTITCLKGGKVKNSPVSEAGNKDDKLYSLNPSSVFRQRPSSEDRDKNGGS